MPVALANLTITWTDNNKHVQKTPVQVNAPTAVPDPDIPVVILLHGLAGSSGDLSLSSEPSYAADMTTPIVTADRGIHTYPGVGVYGFAEDGLLSPPPVGWEPYLLSQGYLTLNYTQVSNTGSLAPVNGQPSDPVRQLHAIVTGVAATFPGRRIAFVTHSRGGLLLRAWLVHHGTDPLVQPRLGTAVQLAAPDQGSSLANIETGLNAEFVALAALAQSYDIPIMQTPLYQQIEGQAGWPGLPDLQVGSAFLQWLAASEPNSRPKALLELATFGGTNPNLTRFHLYVFTGQSAIPIFTWEGLYFVVTFHWYTADVGFPCRNFPGDIGAALQAPPEIVPGEGDVLVAATSAALPWQAEHYVNPVNHGQVLWDGAAKAQALPVLKNAWGSLPVPREPGLDVFAAGPDGNLGRSWQTTAGGGWSAWTDLFVAITGNPVAVQNADGRLEVFAKSADGSLGHTWQQTPGANWYPWTDLGPAITGNPAVCCNANGCLEVFAIGPDGNLGHTWQTTPGGSWYPWTSMGVAIAGNPAVSRNADGRIEVFANGPAPAGPPALGHMWQVTPGGGWSAWTDFGTIPGEWTIHGDPVVAQNADGRLEIFATGPDGNLGHIWQNAPSTTTNWSSWADLGPAVTTNPAVARNANGTLEVFAVSPVSAGPPALGHAWQDPNGPNGGWSAWTPFGTIPGEWSARGDPVVAQNADGRLEVFAIGPDGNLAHAWQNEANTTWNWTTFQDLGPPITTRPAGASNKAGP